MQAAARAAIGEVAHGLSVGLVLLAGRRCPDCAPVLHCPTAVCPAVAGAACPTQVEGFSILFLLGTWLVAFVLGGVSILLVTVVTARVVPSAPPRLARGGPGRLGVWGAPAVRDGSA